MDVPSRDIPLALIDRLRRAQRVMVLTGAGMSAESNVPTFREAQTGLWARYDPAQLATPEAFARDPRLVWEWYAWRRELVTHASPNAGHYALVDMARELPELTLVTQNIDGLHQAAGSRQVVELHGNIQRFICSEERGVVDSWPPTDDVPPHCPRCRGLLRPDVVWFGEALPAAALEHALRAAQECDLFLSIGTSGLVHPAASLPYEALTHGAVTVEINPEATPLSAHATFVVRGPAGRILPALVHATWRHTA